MDEASKMDETLKRLYKFKDIYGCENFVVLLGFYLPPSAAGLLCFSIAFLPDVFRKRSWSVLVNTL